MYSIQRGGKNASDPWSIRKGESIITIWDSGIRWRLKRPWRLQVSGASPTAEAHVLVAAAGVSRVSGEGGCDRVPAGAAEAGREGSGCENSWAPWEQQRCGGGRAHSRRHVRQTFRPSASPRWCSSVILQQEVLVVVNGLLIAAIKLIFFRQFVEMKLRAKTTKKPSPVLGIPSNKCRVTSSRTYVFFLHCDHMNQHNLFELSPHLVRSSPTGRRPYG